MSHYPLTSEVNLLKVKKRKKEKLMYGETRGNHFWLKSGHASS